MPTDLAALHRRPREPVPLGDREGRPASSTIDCEPLPEPLFVDREMWEKVVLNLLSNAFKHTFDGPDHGRAALRAATAPS